VHYDLEPVSGGDRDCLRLLDATRALHPEPQTYDTTMPFG
jgi:hypothetical protein